MEDGYGVDDAFSTERLWQQSTYFADPKLTDSTLFAPLQLDSTAPEHDLAHELRLPDLDSFEFGPLPDLHLDESTVSLETVPTREDEDLWQEAFDLGPANQHVLFHTWEAFENKQHTEHHTVYATECGPQFFDAALANDSHTINAGKVVKGHVLLQSLWNLGLGRSSILFHFNSKLKSFEPTIKHGRPSGVSLEAAQSFTARFIHLGNTFLYLRCFAERTFSSTSSMPARVALATSVANILYTLEDHLGRCSSNITTLIQLQHQFSKPREILVHLAHMVDATKHAKNNEQLSSVLHHRLLEVEEGNSDVRLLSFPVLRQVAQPTLELLEEWIGTRKEDVSVPVPAKGSFVELNSHVAEDAPIECLYRSEMMPRYIAPEDGNTIFETGTSLRFLRIQHPDHPLVNLDKYGIEPPNLEWSFKWQDIEAISTKAKAYENMLRQTLLDYGKGVDMEEKMLAHEDRSADLGNDTGPTDLDKYFELSMEELNSLPQHLLQSTPNELQQIVTTVLDSTNAGAPASNIFSPPLSLTSSLSFRPLISAQAKLINAATLRLFFRSHHLRHHLLLQRQYHLLGDGVFSSLLAASLFDPDRESAERHKGQMRSGVYMGLQLGSRTAWPPASSELRLALRGVLSESYYSSALYQASEKGTAPLTSTTIAGRDNDELPGQLNFAIRNLSEAEQEKVMDPDALPALDFLRLQYVPPVPLNLVITVASLEKYDSIFKFLLRLLRVLFVVSHLPRDYADTDSRHFRLEAHHFVTVLANYVFQTGIASHWDEFDTFVRSAETRLAAEDAAGEYGTKVVEGIAALRDAHEKCLDSIMFSLLLRRRQRKVVALVEEIFDHILLFAKQQNRDAPVSESAAGLHAKLRGKIRVFLSVCRELTGKKGYGTGSGTAEQNSMERLAVAMEMNGYFAGS